MNLWLIWPSQWLAQTLKMVSGPLGVKGLLVPCFQPFIFLLPQSIAWNCVVTLNKCREFCSTLCHHARHLNGYNILPVSTWGIHHWVRPLHCCCTGHRRMWEVPTPLKQTLNSRFLAPTVPTLDPNSRSRSYASLTWASTWAGLWPTRGTTN